RVTGAGAFGATMSNTVVTSGGTLELGNVTLTGEQLSVTGTGFAGRGALLGVANTTSTLQQDAVGTQPVVLAGNTTIGAEAGATVNISGEIAGGSNTVTKILPGTLRYSGTQANTYTGTTTVNEGTLRLAKTGTGANEVQTLTF